MSFSTLAVVPVLWPATLPRLDAFTAIAAAALLIFVPHLVKAVAVNSKLAQDAKAAKANDDKKGKGGGYDLRAPRMSVEKAIDSTPEGRFVARCQGAHLNAIENFPFFATAVILATITGLNPVLVDTSATLYVVVRCAYTLVYMLNTTQVLAMTRSALWFLSLGICSGLVFAAAEARNKANGSA